MFGCSLITRLADQTKTQQLKWLWSKDSMNSTINQRLVEQTQEMNCKLEGSGGSTLDDTLRKQYSWHLSHEETPQIQEPCPEYPKET